MIKKVYKLCDKLAKELLLEPDPDYVDEKQSQLISNVNLLEKLIHLKEGFPVEYSLAKED
jgi:hypothetical protein